MSGAAVVRGFRFGMLLQLAVGPVCLFIFEAASAQGLATALAGVAGVALADGTFIAAALLGVAGALGRPGLKKVLRGFGAVVLCLFGISTILGQFGVTLLPGLALANKDVQGSTFLRALLLTASNPLTILFWAGVFSGKVVELGMGRREVWLFGAGALLSTAAFLSLVALIGNLAGTYLPALAIKVLNVGVGVALVGFGVRMAIQKKLPASTSNHE